MSIKTALTVTEKQFQALNSAVFATKEVIKDHSIKHKNASKMNYGIYLCVKH